MPTMTELTDADRRAFEGTLILLRLVIEEWEETPDPERHAAELAAAGRHVLDAATRRGWQV